MFAIIFTYSLVTIQNTYAPPTTVFSIDFETGIILNNE